MRVLCVLLYSVRHAEGALCTSSGASMELVVATSSLMRLCCRYHICLEEYYCGAMPNQTTGFRRYRVECHV
ncbi:hypothetical protein KC19_12G075900 [Ceratodon purpureus]|uniref:Secreted protein n=1 Tax=Ceratodon purpureus TaxID=3225 RepID=A0A8T0G4Q1_CERPU|nr:hypothetical protein KC19_12G075900 [Ceratodon purpureus]